MCSWQRELIAKTYLQFTLSYVCNLVNNLPVLSLSFFLPPSFNEREPLIYHSCIILKVVCLYHTLSLTHIDFEDQRIFDIHRDNGLYP